MTLSLQSACLADARGKVSSGQRGGRPLRPIAALEMSWVGTAVVVKRPDGRRHIGYALMAGKEEW
jgi:hypothetical protein